MDFLKELFGTEALTYEQFAKAVNDKGFKLADLATGNYVSKKKYEDELGSRDTTITNLQGQITTRDTDIKNLKKELESGEDTAGKLEKALGTIKSLQGDYTKAKEDFDAQLKSQAYEFAVKDYASGKSFTSKAAKRDFINEMIAKNLTMENKQIIGADDFAKSYQEANADAFVPAKQEPANEPPKFVNPATNPNPAPEGENAFINAFNFMGVRPHDTK